ncbi:MAG: MAPEG family protein [Polyangiaceae bacterium]
MNATLTTLALYAVFAALLCVLLLAIDLASGIARVRSRTTLNPEDAATILKSSELVPTEPESVARALRAHRNALANIVPFLVAMFLWVLLGAPRPWVFWLSAIFTGARVAHAVAYIASAQPWRSTAFAIGFTCQVITFAQLLRTALPLCS